MRFPYRTGRHQDRGDGQQDRRPAGRADQSPLDQEPDREPGRHQALCHRRLQQQRRREHDGGGSRPRRDAGGGPRPAAMARVRVRLAQSKRPVCQSADRRALGRRQRARRTRQRSGARLHDVGEGRRLLRLALQLFRPACRHARPPPATGSGGQGDCAGLCARRAHRFARPRLQHGTSVSAGDARAAPSSASTARGIASRAPATR